MKDIKNRTIIILIVVYLIILSSNFFIINDKITGRVLGTISLMVESPDADNDGVPDAVDNCIDTPNSNQQNSDNDGVGDACDNCPLKTNPSQTDNDNDDVGNACDNCPNIYNSEQSNLDGDQNGDVCDNDIDGDGIPNVRDLLLGNKTHIKTNIHDLIIKIDGSENISRDFNPVAYIEFSNDTNNFLEFEYNFSMNQTLELSKVTIQKQTATSENGFMLVKGIDSPIVRAKTIFVDNINKTRSSICIKDYEINSIGEISSDCNSSYETKILCPGSVGSYTCLDFNKQYKIQGLTHSGIIETSDDKKEIPSTQYRYKKKLIIPEYQEIIKKALFDILVEIPSKYKVLIPRGELLATITLINFGDEIETNVNIFYTIKSLDKIISTDNETMMVLGDTSFIKRFRLPKTIEPNNYILHIQIFYNNQSAISYDSFKVIKLEKQLVKNPVIILSSLMIPFIIISMIIIYIYYRLKRLNRK
ncbi:MAG: thrombospondin type 3 repeat-containing protein [Nanoarchaeota archaeon]|nr:thrombospondin type 3 repeat-containing protein [Nanoarchaeota archaeon]